MGPTVPTVPKPPTPVAPLLPSSPVPAHPKVARAPDSTAAAKIRTRCVLMVASSVATRHPDVVTPIAFFFVARMIALVRTGQRAAARAATKAMVALTATIAACGETRGTLVTTDASVSTPWRPAISASWQVQLEGTLDTSLDVSVYEARPVRRPAGGHRCASRRRAPGCLLRQRRDVRALAQRRGRVSARRARQCRRQLPAGAVAGHARRRGPGRDDGAPRPRRARSAATAWICRSCPRAPPTRDFR